MRPLFLFLLILAYFLLLMWVSKLTSKDDGNRAFYKANRNSPWYVVAFGMIGASLSGVTFISVPGWVGSTQFSYFQIVVGYTLGYFLIAWLLIPLYYKMNLTSIYAYLGERFGQVSHQVGAFFFLLSRLLIASFRLFLVSAVLQYFILDAWSIPFELTVVLSVAFIWMYTHRAGIKTLVWTDTIQTFFMLAAAGASLWFLLGALDLNGLDLFNDPAYLKHSKTWFTEEFTDRKHWLKSLVGGLFIAFAMTGLDQDNMQKNLSCRNIKSAQKNVVTLGLVLLPVNFLFLLVGALLFMYAEAHQLPIPQVDGKTKTDLLYPQIALNGQLSPWLSFTFLIGLIAAAYSSADSAITSMTTSINIDFLEKSKEKKVGIQQRKKVHLFVSIALILVIILYRYILEDNVIALLLQVSTYTYGPLLGLFAFGLLTRYQIKEKWLVLVCCISLLSTYLLNHFSVQLLFGYQFGYEILLFNGIFTFLGLLAIKKGPKFDKHGKRPERLQKKL